MKTFFKSPLLLLLILLLQACSTMRPDVESEQPEPEQAAVEAIESQQPQVDPQARQLFDEAVQAMHEKRYEAAKRQFVDLTRRYPDFSGPYVNLGLIALEEQENDTAADFFAQAISVNPENSYAYTMAGLLARKQGNFSEAESMYLKAIEVEPGNAAAHLNLGIVYDLYMGKFDQALQHYKEYQSLQAEPVEQVKFWIVDIESRLGQ